MDTRQRHTSGQTAASLSALPKELLQAILEDVPDKYGLRVTCKAFSIALTDSCDSILVNKAQLLSKGPGREIDDAFRAFPLARRVVVDLNEDRWACNSHVATEDQSPQVLLADALVAMRGRRISSLALLNIPCRAPSPGALASHRYALDELELSDSLYSSAVEQGAMNAMRSRESLPRGDAMIKLALSLPNLRRLSIASAAFSAQSVLALGTLTQLESLSIAGSMVCTGGAAEAAATHRSLLSALPALRQLRLPMALPSCDTDGLDSDEEGNPHGEEDDNDAARGSDDGEGGRDDGTGRDGSDTDNNSSHSAQRARAPVATAAPRASRLLFPTTSAPAPLMLNIWNAPPGAVQRAAAPPGGAAASLFGRARDRGEARRFFCRVGLAGAHRNGGGPRQLKRELQAADLAAGFVFPPRLQDLTIPLCAFNRPVFEALCAAYSSGGELPRPSAAGGDASTLPNGGGGPAGGSSTYSGGSAFACRRTASYPSLTAAAPQAADRAAAPASGELEAWLPSPFGAASPLSPRGSSVPPPPSAQAGFTADGTTGAAPASVDLLAVTSSARPPRPPPMEPHTLALSRGGSGPCGRSGTAPWPLRTLHIPSLGGYSHWDGSFLASARDFEKLAGLRGLESLHLSLELSALRVTRDSLRACFQHLRYLTELKELRISEAQQPVCFTARKRAYSTRDPGPFGASSAPGAAPSLDGPALRRLQSQWPRLRSLQFFAETVVRRDGRLELADRPEYAELLPPRCACCKDPHLLARSRGRGHWVHVD
ncbi:hypothetical protein GPECTOR_2g1353 [Gonium pectorale]|uniref:F-box domain-containing protein n=1 Tax=Gonium pectorale TaxID=33097 RepID=A0A150H1C1_GONPE|nr:hypothetical protein GPECTOR_2g1353 [Gonium pectorale]|eukprot:KXZ55803.1 hypothetical protein GPECTOR_2g1353 [Gonium pectorale]